MSALNSSGLKIEARHPNAKKIHLFLDNASYYKAKWLEEQLKLRRSSGRMHGKFPKTLTHPNSGTAAPKGNTKCTKEK